ncbi:MAG: PQQ-dependent sugar dehydrogenase [Gammaproteobacteria bacterium]
MKTRIALLCLLLSTAQAEVGEVYQSLEQDFRVEEVSAGLDTPWGMAFLPDASILITQRGGGLRHLREGRLLEIDGVPASSERGQGGLLGIALHPDFARNRYIYLAYTSKGKGGYSTEVARAVLDRQRLTQVETIFIAQPRYRGGRHFGARLVFDAAGKLYVSLGDRGERHPAQDLDDHAGSLIRINDDGSVPADNPFVNQPRHRPEIFTYGNRNMQGMAVHPLSGAIWTHEHGPQGGDEVNLMRAGMNYGWPVITYGVNYGLGTRIGEGTHKPGMQQPLHTWVPSIAPSGMAFYTGDKLPGWRGNLFVGSLRFGQLARLTLDGEKVLAEERLFDGEHGRIRDVVSGPDGLLYLLTDSSEGKLLRIVPATPE